MKEMKEMKGMKGMKEMIKTFVSSILYVISILKNCRLNIFHLDWFNLFLHRFSFRIQT
jgi:hypothetical protein